MSGTAGSTGTLNPTLLWRIMGDGQVRAHLEQIMAIVELRFGAFFFSSAQCNAVLSVGSPRDARASAASGRMALLRRRP